MPNILIADDEKEIVRLLKIYLNEYDVFEANDGQQALAVINSQPIDLAIVDIMMPKVDGYQLITKIREKSSYIPVIIISAKVTLSDRILGMDIGADDYITKPFNILEVKARIKAIMRRASLGQSIALEHKTDENIIENGDLVLDKRNRGLTILGQEYNLTSKEFEMLLLLVTNPKKVFSREDLLHTIWGEGYPGDERTVDVHVRRLREKIEPNPKEPKYVRTKWGVGYYYM